MRWWNEAVADLGDVIPVPLLAFLSLVLTLIIALLLYFWPLNFAWGSGSGRRRRDRSKDGRVGGRRFRFGALRWRWRLRWRRRRRQASELDDLPADELPDLPASVLALTADELAAAGRYAEAVRERLRAIVRDLIERDVIPNSPGWTVTELARAAVQTRPALGSGLNGAVRVFSEIWYGLKPATADDDQSMRGYAAATAQALALAVAQPVGSAP
jgi:hypothetical protein